MKNQQSINAQLQELQEQNQLMRQLATPAGFFEYFFKQLPHHNTQVECFNAINETYFDLFGEYRYSSYYSFRAATMDRNKKRKK